MVKPSLTDRHIYLGRNPLGSVFGSCTQQGFNARLSGIQGIGCDCIPVGSTCYSFLIPYPAHPRTGIAEEYNLRLHLPDKVKRSWPVIISSTMDATLFICPAIVTRSSVGTIKPHFKHRAVSLKQFLKLIAVIGNVFRRAIAGMMAIPRGEIDTKLHLV